MLPQQPSRFLPWIVVSVLLLSVPSIADDPPVLDLTPYEGQVVLVDFWASWCAPCLESFPWMGEQLERYGDKGLTIIAVNMDEDPERASEFLEGMAAGFEHKSDPDGTIAEAFGITAMPSSVLFDRDGNPAYIHSGFRQKETAEYERRIVALLEGRDDPDREEITLEGTGKRRGVRPWERGLLADADMLLGSDPLDLALDDHIYFSKEASSGGRGFGGGGCGCN